MYGPLCSPRVLRPYSAIKIMQFEQQIFIAEQWFSCNGDGFGCGIMQYTLVLSLKDSEWRDSYTPHVSLCRNRIDSWFMVYSYNASPVVHLWASTYCFPPAKKVWFQPMIKGALILPHAWVTVYVVSCLDCRVYIEGDSGGLGLRLFIDQIGAEDAGFYTCEADINGELLSEVTSLSLFGKWI